ncbi:MAG: RnfABCDGE type electron transport complex subunit G [Bacteroidales bacterium]|nr:RnfABCDGE type electron transport complex subunit G [Bacteroidales bacterium]
MFLTLLIVTAVSSLAASSVYNLTKEPIAEVQRIKQQKAIEQVMPGFTNYIRKAVKPEDASDSLIFFNGFKNETAIGVAVNTYTNIGYSGLIKLMVGFQPDGTITNVEVLEQKETPGLGTKMATSWKDQFMGKNPKEFKLAVKKDGGDVDAITAATITSRAFCDAVQRAYTSYEEMNKENN